ncbi:hypothetical protein MARPU_09500 [Marichromatium purpuratum 984]|uniref:Uncharacterized protein n=1 Tax=Marichromatium purpuratum 984 TaxID=765910 RepID=W0E4D2_MARPU|nr:hypothetical protein [Marichromatium purpuratum]AHF04074.1 hypothetical protein MARPU_09500 [Marichromatium purpuratum 984]
MILTRTDTAAAIELPDDLYWEDEHISPIAQSIEPSLTGAALIQEAARQWRPMTLRPWKDDASWITRATLDTLLAWASVPGLSMSMTRLGVTHAVRWHHSGTAIERTPVSYWVNDTADSDEEPQYRATLRFLILEE